MYSDQLSNLFRSQPEFPIPKMLQPLYDFGLGSKRDKYLVDHPERVMLRYMDPLGDAAQFYVRYNSGAIIDYFDKNSLSEADELYRVSVFLTNESATEYEIAFYLSLNSSTFKPTGVYLESADARTSRYARYNGKTGQKEMFFSVLANAIGTSLGQLNTHAGSSEFICNALTQREGIQVIPSFTQVSVDLVDIKSLTKPSWADATAYYPGDGVDYVFLSANFNNSRSTYVDEVEEERRAKAEARARAVHQATEENRTSFMF